MAMEFIREGKCEIDGIACVGMVEDANSPERVMPEGNWTGSRYRDVDQHRRILKDDISPVFKSTSIHIELLKALIDDWLTSGGGVVDATGVNQTIKWDAGAYGIAVDNCKPDSLTIRGESNRPIEVEAAYKSTDTARDYTGTVGTITSYVPLIFSDLALTAGGTTYNPSSFELVISNNLDEDFGNKVTRNQVGLGEFTVTGSFEVDVNATTWGALFDDVEGTGTVAVAATIAYGGKSIALSCAYAGITERPQPPESGQFRAPFAFEAYIDETGYPVTYTATGF